MERNKPATEAWASLRAWNSRAEERKALPRFAKLEGRAQMKATFTFSCQPEPYLFDKIYRN